MQSQHGSMFYVWAYVQHITTQAQQRGRGFAHLETKKQTCFPHCELGAALLKQLNVLVAGPAARTRYELTEPVCYRGFITESTKRLRRVTLVPFRSGTQPDYLLYAVSQQIITQETQQSLSRKHARVLHGSSSATALLQKSSWLCSPTKAGHSTATLFSGDNVFARLETFVPVVCLDGGEQEINREWN